MRWLFWIVDLILPVTMIVIGIYYLAKKSKQPISKTSGFRTGGSMSSCKSWAMAHRMAGKCLVVGGGVLCLYALIIKLVQPLPAEWLSLVNNGIYIIAYIGITITVNSRIQK